jgi:hypothetical protein
MNIAVTKLQNPVLIKKYQIKKYMKSIIIIPFLFLAICVNSQTDVLPQNINDAFFQKYPKARDVNWTKDSIFYSIEFYQYGDLYTSLYDEEGNWIETGVVIADNELPVKIRQELTAKYPGSIIVYSERVETIKGDKYYRVNVETNSESLIVSSDSQGNIAKITKSHNL